VRLHFLLHYTLTDPLRIRLYMYIIKIVARFISHVPSRVRQTGVQKTYHRGALCGNGRIWEEFGWRSGSSARLVQFRPYILTSFMRWGAQSDMLMWLMSEAKGVERSLEGWARRLLNVAAFTTLTVSYSARFRFRQFHHS
jgi:hypothetical protein